MRAPGGVTKHVAMGWAQRLKRVFGIAASTGGAGPPSVTIEAFE